MEIFPLKGSWLPRDRNPSETELLERIRTILFIILYVCICIYYTTLCYHPKSKRAEPHSIHPLGVLFKNQFPPTTSLGEQGRAWPHLRGNCSPHWIPAAGETLLAQRAHCFGSSSEVPWNTNLVPPAALLEHPHTEKPSHGVEPTTLEGDTWLQPTVLRNLQVLE